MGRKSLGNKGKTKSMIFRLTPEEYKQMKKNHLRPGDIVRSKLQEISMYKNEPNKYEKNLKKKLEDNKKKK